MITNPYARRFEYRSALAERIVSKLGVALFDTKWWIGVARYGYPVVHVEQRGAGASFGSRSVHMDQRLADMIDVLDWIVAQPWSDGRVASCGVSQIGMTAQIAAGTGHPALIASIPMFSAYDMYGALHPGGLMQAANYEVVEGLMRALDSNQVHKMLPYKAAQLAMRLFIKGIAPVDADRDRSLLRAAAADHSANTYYQEGNTEFRDDEPADGSDNLDMQSAYRLEDVMRKNNVRVAAYSGWYDNGFANEMIQARHSVSPHNGRLVLGPWPHGGSTQGGPAFNRTRRKANSSFDFPQDIARFMQSLDNPEGGPETYYWTLVEEAWKRATTWPVPAETMRYFLGDGALMDEAPKAAEHTYQVDPEARGHKTSRWGIGLNGTKYPGGWGTGGALGYTSAPVARDTEVTGHPKLTIRMSSDRGDGALFAYLLDVAPDGSVAYVTEGLLRLASRRPKRMPYEHAPGRIPRTFSRVDSEPMPKGVPQDIELDLQPTSWLFRAGHRIRLEIAGANKESFVIPDGGESATYVVTIGPSSLELPVVV
ncbi:MAG: CocE/NonD family hydrolase [Marmoricola sp.]